MSNRYVLIVFATFSSWLISFAAQPGPLFQQRAAAELRPVANVLIAEFSAGELPAGKSGTVSVELANPTGVDLPLGAIHSSCSCTQASFSEPLIPAYGAVVLELKIDVPAKRKSPDFTAAISFKVGSGAGGPYDQGAVKMHFRLAGMLNFKDAFMPLEVPREGEVAFDVPFISTLPPGFERFKLTFEPHLPAVDAVLHTEGEQKSIRLLVDSSALPDGVNAVVATLSELSSGMSDTVTLVFKAREDVVVSPRTIRFRRTPGGYEASVLIRAAVTPHPELNAVSNANQDAYIEAAIDGIALEVSSKQIGPGIVRAKLIALNKDGETLEELSKVRWSMTFGAERFLAASDCIFEN
jgi:hypothetical protein